MSVNDISVQPSVSCEARRRATSQIRQLNVRPRKLCENMSVLSEQLPTSDFLVALISYSNWNGSILLPRFRKDSPDATCRQSSAALVENAGFGPVVQIETQEVRMRRLSLLLLGASLQGLVSAVNATPVVPPDPPMSSDRVDRLPVEIRTMILSRCGANAEAGHYFATYDQHSKAIHLDYSLLYCPGVPTGVEAFGHLHQTFVEHDGRYVLPRTERRPLHSHGATL
jgi:hypothetical protein